MLLTAGAPGLRGLVREHEPLARHTSLGIGGPARFWVEPADPEDVARALAFARAQGLPWLVLGNGTNVLFSDRGWPGLVLHLGPRGGLSGWRRAGEVLTAGAGASLAAVRRAGGGALDFLYGIPGTVGGALAMNAGIPAAEIGARVRSVTALDPQGRVRVLSRERCGFGYRASRLRRAGWVVLEARLDLAAPATWDLAALRRRRAAQPAGRSPGCVFKNPSNFPHGAGWLLDRCGLKGLRIGGAQIARSHANFILNRGGARSADVLALIDIAREKVYKEFQVELDLELEVFES